MSTLVELRATAERIEGVAGGTVSSTGVDERVTVAVAVEVELPL
jgi:hypothetical protein